MKDGTEWESMLTHRLKSAYFIQVEEFHLLLVIDDFIFVPSLINFKSITLFLQL